MILNANNADPTFPALTCVNDWAALSAAICTPEQPAFVLERSLPFSFEQAAGLLTRHGSEFIGNLEDCNFALSREELQKLAVALPRLGKEFATAKYKGVAAQIDFIIADMQLWKDNGVISDLRFIPPTGYGVQVVDEEEAQFAEVIHSFHRDGLPDGKTTLICSYTQDVTESISRNNSSLSRIFHGLSIYTANDSNLIEKSPAGSVTRFSGDWIHRAPVNAGSRLVLVTR